MSSRVLCISTHTIDLSDGRPLAPGETADGIDESDTHNAELIANGHLITLASPATSAAAPLTVKDPPIGGSN
jgi:hypothetical protein